MKKKMMLAVVMGFMSINTMAASVELFNANKSCQAKKTRTGIRYVPPCDFSQKSVTPNYHKTLPAGHELLNGVFRSTLRYHYTCESLKPLSIAYEITDAGVPLQNGTLAGSAIFTPLVSTVTHHYDELAFSVKTLVGATGFQAIKPGCQLAVDGFVAYPDPAYYALMANSLIQVDNLLANIVRVATPGIDYITSLGVIDNALFLLDFIKSQTNDVTQGMIDTTISQLVDSKANLAHACEADSAAQLCSRAIKNTRIALQDESQQNENKLINLRDYLEEQKLWLDGEGTDVGADTSKLNDIIVTIDNQL